VNDIASRRQRNLKRLLSPRHVAFFGGQYLNEPIRLCREAGFKGAIWPVNPKYKELAGLPCFPSVEALPEPPDASFIAVPREAAVEVTRALAARGAGGAICYTAGFAEVGPEGAALQQALVEASGDLALVGPNCYGLINYLDGLVLFASGAGGKRVEGGVAFVGQSGNIALTATFNHRSVPFAYVISAGNQAVLGIADYVDALADDPRVSVIALYVEGLTDVPAFARAALKAQANNKPVVVLKVGNSALGVKLALSHTSSLAGDDNIYSALFERLGIIRVPTLPALLETAKLLAVAGHPPGDRLAVFTCSGGDGLMTADEGAVLGLNLPELSPAQVVSLRQQLPNFASISNPLDYNTALWGRHDLLVHCFSTVLGGDYDAGMLAIDFPNDDEKSTNSCNISVAALTEAGKRHGRQVLVTSTLPECLPEAAREAMVRQGVAPMQGLGDALRAFVGANWQRRRHAELRADPLLAAIMSLPQLSDRRQVVGEWEAKQMLAAHGVPVPPARLAAASELAGAAAAIGYPVVLKAARPAIAHKTEAGAVALNLRDEAHVRQAADAIAQSVRRYDPALAVETFLVERQVTGAVAEMIVGVKRDSQFGLVLVVGAGGILVEMVADSAALILPTTRDEVEGAIAGLKVAKLLAGYRGRPAGDMVALVDAVMAAAAFAQAEAARLVELDINPLLVLANGQGVRAVDALVVFGEP